MISLKHWSLLQHPDTTNPLFRRTVQVSFSGTWKQIKNAIPRPWWWLVVLILLLINPVYVLLAVVVIPLGLLILFVMSPLFMPLLVTIAAVYWTASISGALVYLQTQRTYDILYLSLDGFRNLSWMIASGCIHRDGLFDTLHIGLRIAAGLGVVAIVMLIGLMLLIPDTDTAMALRTLMEMITLLIAFYVHHVQTVGLSLMSGVYVSTFATSQLEARVLAGGLFLGLQVGSYGLFVALVTLLAPLDIALQTWSPLVYVLMPVFYLGMFTGIRELMVTFLWQALTARQADSRKPLLT
ncbi:MAG: hypothetical protein K8L99_27445 [Anaerolineae bacterium]|nr:hypothetical protein [Anaerolineae bacterium]